MTVVQQPSSTRAPTGLLVASTLCWIWGVMCGLAGIMFLTPALRIPGFGVSQTIMALALLAVALVNGLAGYLIRRRRALGRWLGLISATLVAIPEAFTLAGGAPPNLGMFFALALNVGILVLLVLNGHAFQTSQTQVGA